MCNQLETGGLQRLFRRKMLWSEFERTPHLARRARAGVFEGSTVFEENAKSLETKKATLPGRLFLVSHTQERRASEGETDSIAHYLRG